MKNLETERIELRWLGNEILIFFHRPVHPSLKKYNTCRKHKIVKVPISFKIPFPTSRPVTAVLRIASQLRYRVR
jgi:hypothetical protein